MNTVFRLLLSLVLLTFCFNSKSFAPKIEKEDYEPKGIVSSTRVPAFSFTYTGGALFGKADVSSTPSACGETDVSSTRGSFAKVDGSFTPPAFSIGKADNSSTRGRRGRVIRRGRADVSSAQSSFGRTDNSSIFAPKIEKEDCETKGISKLELHKQPELPPLDSRQSTNLIARANKGDKEAQDEIIERNYWGLIDKQFQNGLWGNVVHRGHDKVNPLSWDNTEELAIADSKYAYALINEYAPLVRWDQSAPAFNVQFPELFRSIQEEAEAGDACASFTLGVLCAQFQSFPERIGFPFTPTDPRNMALEWTKKAATQGHSLATSAMGLMSHQGFDNLRGLNTIEPLRWYFASKENKISQDALRQLLVCQRQPAHEEGSFQSEVEGIKERLEEVWGRHFMQIEAHNPEGEFLESSFTIPQLALHYKNIIGIEDEALGLLSDLQKATPGLLMTGVKIRDESDRRNVKSQKGLPYVSVTSYDGVEYHTLGEDNVSLAARLLTYIDGIEDRFAEATGILKKIKGYYEAQLDFAVGELMKLRLLAIAKKDTDSAQRFEEQRRSVAELEELFKSPLGDIDEECGLLNDVKESIKNIVTRGLGLRNQDFFREHPYLI